MKNILKYSFSILIMISCLVLFTIMAFKVLILEESPVGKDDDTQAPPSEETQDGEDKREEQNPPQPEPDVKDPKDAPFTAADPTYLSDALFIGDSRTLGLSAARGQALWQGMPACTPPQPLSFTKTGYGNAGSKGSKVSAFPAP